MAKLSCKYDIRDVYDESYRCGDHTHQVFARTSETTVPTLIREQQNWTLYNFDEPSITNCTQNTYSTRTKSLTKNCHFRASFLLTIEQRKTYV